MGGHPCFGAAVTVISTIGRDGHTVDIRDTDSSSGKRRDTRGEAVMGGHHSLEDVRTPLDGHFAEHTVDTQGRGFHTGVSLRQEGGDPTNLGLAIPPMVGNFYRLLQGFPLGTILAKYDERRGTQGEAEMGGHHYLEDVHTPPGRDFFGHVVNSYGQGIHTVSSRRWDRGGPTIINPGIPLMVGNFYRLLQGFSFGTILAMYGRGPTNWVNWLARTHTVHLGAGAVRYR